MNTDHVFVILSATHPDPKVGQISGIAAVRTNHKGKVLATYSGSVRLIAELSAEERAHLGGVHPAIDGDAEPFSSVQVAIGKSILSDKFESNYVVVGNPIDRTYLKEYTGERPELFPRRSWIDILAISWPLCYHDMISDRTFESLCRHFNVQNPAENTATGNCEALVRVYWAVMARYKIALGGEEIVREVGGSAFQTVLKMVGL